MTYEITIASKVYDCADWRLVDLKPPLRREWSQGLLGGMGAYYDDDDPTRFYMGRGIDVSLNGYLRLSPAINATITDTDLDGSLPVFVFRAQDASANVYEYVLNGRYAYKFKVSDASVTIVDFGAGAVCGRPQLFLSEWHIPLRGTVNAVRGDTIGVSSGAAHNDTWTSLGVTALHFDIRTLDSVGQLVRAFSTNKINFSVNGTTYQPSAGFEIGDSSETITDLLLSGTRVVKQSSVWSFDEQGHAFQLETFAGKHANVAAHSGANSFQHGDITFWPHKGGLTRIVGSAADSIGFEVQPEWVTAELDGYANWSSVTQWQSFAAWGRWCYGTLAKIGGAVGPALMYGYLIGDRVHWLGAPFLGPQGSDLRCFLSDGPVLWLVTGGAAWRFALHSDGSLRTALGANRGRADTTYQMFFPTWRIAEGKIAQLRRMWALCDNWATDLTGQLAVFRDRATSSESLGTAITTSGYAERAWTAGTSDTAREVMASLILTSGSSYDPAASDARIREMGIEAHGPAIYRARLQFRDSKHARNWREDLVTLRGLRQSAIVAFVAPHQKVSFNGYITAHSEHVVDDGYDLDIEISRYDWSNPIS